MPNAADILIDTLIEWKVDVVFGLPGDGINGIMEALRRRQDRIRFVSVRHEQSAAFMACAYAKFTGRLGVCLATSGPGGTNLLTGLYDAKLDQMPVLAITGMQYHDLIETFSQQDVDLTRVFDNVAVYNAQVNDAAHMENLANLACRSALSKRGVAHLSIANDVQERMADGGRSRRNRPGHMPSRNFAGRLVPLESDLSRAADLLNAGKKVAILAGRGALEARDALRETADLLGAPVAKALLGKAVLPDGDPLTTGGIGILGTAPSQDIMQQCDTLLIVGSTFPYIEYYPAPNAAAGIQIDHDPQRIGLRYPVEVGLVGEANETLRMLNKRLKRKSDRSFLERAQEATQVWRRELRSMEEDKSSPLKPQPVVGAFGKRIAANGVLVCDSGQNTELTARHIDLGADHMFSVSGALASMASALPYAIAAGIALPGRPVYAVVGDGGFAMQLGELSTAIHHRIPLKLLVIRNDMLNQIAWEQMMFLGNPQFACELPPIDFAAAAEAMGARGFTIQSFDGLEEIMDQAFAVEGPVVIQALVDRYEPLMPPKMPEDYARNFRAALPETPGHEKIEENLKHSPLGNAAADQNPQGTQQAPDENTADLPGIP
ncbi:putative thiamine pyrophosphate-containing protein YdaP [Ensifer psoraleae]|uniref:thiamine pyrophosphate-binding protein n=1 Tax=Sinorhizobium psoraleae TaxID=520838 RepID=UPI001567C6D4|nr:thiamine pyrophosphate-binding protein [Sinorhizobium psoraleae]NRP74276.1 putative thiamine pyrophosphate-containing protein YdaP [Sinorhizobium psoraleae]